MKQLKTRKERSGGREASKSKPHRHHCGCQSGKEMAHFSNCCRNNYNCCSTGVDSNFPNVIPAAQEPSIITESRLIGHHGLFNHEVKSIDIERLLSEQVKHEKTEQQVKEKKHAMSQLCLSPHNSSKDLLDADNDDIVSFEKKSDTSTDIHEKDNIVSQRSDVTPGQRPRHEICPSSVSDKSLFALKNISCDAPVIKSKKTSSVMSEKCKKLSSRVDKDNVKTFNKKLKTFTTSTLEHTPKNKKPPIQQTKTHSLSPSPLQLSSSPISEAFDRRLDPSCVSESVCAVAARLCDCLHFTCLTKQNLVTETREVLLRSLQKRHGPHLQENLLKLQQRHKFGTDVTRAVEDEKPPEIDEDVFFSTGRH